MNTQAMLENATEEGQTSMVKEFAAQTTEFDMPVSEEDFRSFCANWKFENNLGHVATPKFI